MSTIIKNSKAYKYATDCVREDNLNINKYVKKQCQEFLDCVDSEHYYIDEKALKITEGFLKLINIMPSKNAYDNLAGFQWFFIINVFCVKRKSNNKRRDEVSILLIGRKQGKTMISSLMFMLLMLQSEPRAEY